MPAPEFLEGKYDVVSKIREGGMGAVYKVRHRLLKELRVVKVMHPQVASSAEQRKRFVREAQTATRLKHPNIVTFYDFAVDPDGTAYMVMEYIDGTDLSDLVRRLGSIPVPIALVLLRQCLSALGYLHRKGIVHRDISPDNILLCRDDDGAPLAKLIDLGIAKVARDEENLTAADEFLGKLRYASPEQLTGPSDGPLDGRSDLYSLGAVGYEILTGFCPFRGKSLQSILAAHLTGPPVPFSESDPENRVPEALQHALLRALEIRPEDRFQSAEDFLAALEALPQRFSPEETKEFLGRAVGAPQAEAERDATAVRLPAPTTGQPEDLRTEAGTARPTGARGLPSTGPRAEPLPATRVPTPADRTVRQASGVSPVASEKTQLYSGARAQTAAGAEAGTPARGSRLPYWIIGIAAAIGLALVWLRSEPAARRLPEGASRTASPPAAAAPLPTEAPATLAPVSPVPTAALPEVTAPPATEPGTTPVSSGSASGTAVRQERSAPRRSPEARVAENRVSRSASQEPAGAASTSRTRYCATIEKTAYSQGAVKEKAVGFARDSAQVFRAGRTDAARIHIDVTVAPERPMEGEPFTVTARIVNDGDMDLMIQSVEESAARQAGGYVAVEGAGRPGAVSVGGVRPIYTFHGVLAGGSTYQKDLRVTDANHDSWKTSIRIVPCD